MKNPVVAYVGWLLLFAAISFYCYGIFEAIRLSWNETPIKENDFPAFLATTISSIQALLLTNLGILLGIAIAKPDSDVARQLMLGNIHKQRITGEIKDPLEIKEKIQLFSLVIYIISLIACMITWVKNDFSSAYTDIVSLISESGKMFIGVVLAYLTAVLGNR
jgi:hypothetical protein